MRPAALAIFALALVGAGSDVAPPAPPAPPTPRPVTLLRVAIIGDSLGVGLSGPLGVEFSMRRRGASVRGHARLGATAGQWLSRGWLEPVLRTRPEAVLISLGTNDSAAPESAAAKAFAENVAELARRIRDAGAEPIFLEPPPMPWPLDDVRAALRATGAPVITPPANLPRQPDRIHPTGSGYALWASHIERALP